MFLPEPFTSALGNKQAFRPHRFDARSWIKSGPHVANSSALPPAITTFGVASLGPGLAKSSHSQCNQSVVSGYMSVDDTCRLGDACHRGIVGPRCRFGKVVSRADAAGKPALLPLVPVHAVPVMIQMDYLSCATQCYASAITSCFGCD